MKFSSREDIDAPIEFVFDTLTDFPAIELAAMRRRIEARRLDTMTTTGTGMSWDIRFKLRGKMREVVATLDEMARPEKLVFKGESDHFRMTSAATLVALTPTRTRVIAELDLRPRTLGARLMVQSAKLGKSSLTRRFNERIAQFARGIETRHARSESV
ncbi:SRPBCC family protein [Phaeovulum vinaykumarii]|uniref:Carbon monoxide dehydrogenase subunit G n=1 Tax=Phaeovulum vinaykumarii TaxID=407234 RepID=A0A1N7K530_9RHOB|nr:SRPBCC family protein [Phaeovulum vinaykumarii]SIS56712.1 Carbon monoxide dehydrogenase subunit G [Phaeovulum vinaykumarii]SOB92995.1 carbon monoxide dehydrogenase subunit G [Phaeovulum vinaykumarii]